MIDPQFSSYAGQMLSRGMEPEESSPSALREKYVKYWLHFIITWEPGVLATLAPPQSLFLFFSFLSFSATPRFSHPPSSSRASLSFLSLSHVRALFLLSVSYLNEEEVYVPLLAARVCAENSCKSVNVRVLGGDGRFSCEYSRGDAVWISDVREKERGGRKREWDIRKGQRDIKTEGSFTFSMQIDCWIFQGARKI